MEDSPGSPEVPLSWEYTMTLLTDRFVLADLIRVTVLAIFALELVILGMSLLVNGEAVLLPLEVLALVTAIMAVLVVFAAGVVLGNRYTVRFTLDRRGVLMESGPRERRWNRIALWVGLLAGKPQLIGAALLSQSREAEAVTWRDVVRAVPHPAQRVAELRNDWRTIMRVYCPPDLYGTIAERIDREVEAASRRRRARLKTLRPLPPRRWGVAAAWLMATAAAFVLANAWPWLPDEARRVSVVAGIVVTAAGLLAGVGGRLCGLLGALLAAVSLVLAAVEASDTFPTFDGGVAATWELETGLLVVSVAALVALGSLGFAATRGLGAGLFLRERVARSTRRGAGGEASAP